MTSQLQLPGYPRQTTFIHSRTLGIGLKFVSADAPKRAAIRKFHSHGAYNPCDYCKVEAKNEMLPQGGSRRFLPFYAPHDDAEERTHEDTLELIEAGDQAAMDNAGVHGRSALYEMPGLDVILDVPVDPAHQLPEGVGKSILE